MQFFKPITDDLRGARAARTLEIGCDGGLAAGHKISKLLLSQPGLNQIGGNFLGIHASTISRSCLDGQHQRDDDLYYIRDMDTLAKRLIWARERKELTQEALAKLGGVSQSTIGNLEAGIRETARKIVDIAMALDVDPAWLASGRGAPSPKVWAGKDETKNPAPESAAPVSQDDILKAVAEMIETYRLANLAERRRIDYAFRQARDRINGSDKAVTTKNKSSVNAQYAGAQQPS